MEIKDNLKRHFVDSVAMFSAANPIFTSIETLIAGMSDKVSLNSKLLAVGVTFAGVGWAIGKGRDVSRKLFHIDDSTKELYQAVHDSAFIAAANIPLSATLYVLSGETDIKKIAIGSGISSLAGIGIGPLLGYSIDIFRDLTGISECNRKLYPKALKNSGKSMKLVAASCLAAASIAAMAGIYHITPSKFSDDEIKPQSHIEQIIEEYNN